MHCPSPSRPNCFPLLFFITGFHHSGTTWLRAEMLRKLGFNNSAINATLREHHPAECNPFPVVKYVFYDFLKGTQEAGRASRTADERNRLERRTLRAGNAVFGAEALESHVPRHCAPGGAALRRAMLVAGAPGASAESDDAAAPRAAGARGRLPRPLLARLEALRVECGFGAATDGARAEATLPGDRDHDARRNAQQLLEANYSDAQASAWRHAPLPLMQTITPFETCACGTRTLSATNNLKS